VRLLFLLPPPFSRETFNPIHHHHHFFDSFTGSEYLLGIYALD
jgi:hypothetical protein